MNYSWRLTGNNVLCPQVLISFKLVDSNNQSILVEDNTEENGKEVKFPNIVAQLTANEKRDLMEAIIQKLIQIKINRFQSQ